jgi:hypothetical protein
MMARKGKPKPMTAQETNQATTSNEQPENASERRRAIDRLENEIRISGARRQILEQSLNSVCALKRLAEGGDEVAIDALLFITNLGIQSLNDKIAKKHPDLVQRRARATFAWPTWIGRKRILKQMNEELMDHLQLGQDDVIFSDKKWQLSALSTRVALSLLIPALVKNPELSKRFPLTKKEKEELFDRLWQQRLAEGWRPEQEEPTAALGRSKAARRPKYCKELHEKTRYDNMRAEIKARVWDSFDTLIAESK